MYKIIFTCIIKIVLLITISLYFSLTIYAQEDDYPNLIRTLLPFLGINTDISSKGMGDCGIATNNTTGILFHNPAKAVFLSDKLIYSNNLQNILPSSNSTAYSFFADYQGIRGSIEGIGRLKNNKMAVGFLFQHNTINTPNSFISMPTLNEMAFGISYAYRFNSKFSVGTGLKYAKSSSKNSMWVSGMPLVYWAHTLALDLGLYFRQPISFSETFKGTLSLGWAIKNMGNKVKYYEPDSKNFIPTNLGMGLAFVLDVDKIYELELTGEANKLLVPSENPDKIDWNNLAAYRDESMFVGMFISFADAQGGFKEEMQEITWQFGQEHRFNVPVNKGETIVQFVFRNGYYLKHREKENLRYCTNGLGINLQYVNYSMGVHSVLLKSLNEFTLNEQLGIQIKLTYLGKK